MSQLLQSAILPFSHHDIRHCQIKFYSTLNKKYVLNISDGSDLSQIIVSMS